MKLYRDFSTQEEIDAQYDVQKSVPNFHEYLHYYIDDSAKARQQLRCETNVAYGPTRDEHLDLFLAAEPNAPVVVFVHGGYWKILSSKEFSFAARGPVANGCHVAVLNYSLCPKVTIDEITRQTRAAIFWIFHHAREFGGDASKIRLVGHSAGGQQVAMALLTDWQEEYGLPAHPIENACSISGLYDLRPFPFSFLQPALQLDGSQIWRNSPLFHFPKTSPRFLIAYGTAEPLEFRRQAEEFYEAWRAAGLPVTLRPMTGKNHFDVFHGLAEADSELSAWLGRS